MSLSSCSLRTVAIRSALDVFGRGIGSFYEESDLGLAEDALAAQLKLVESVLKSEPTNREALMLAAQGFDGYAFLFVEPESPERAKSFYKRTRDYGLRVLQPRTRLDWITADLPALERALERLGPKDAEALFWAGYGWGGWANLSRDDPQALADLPKVERIMRRVDALAPGFFYGGPDVFLGAYFGSRPKMFGGDLEKARAHFEAAAKYSDRSFLIVQTLCAQFYAVPAQDRELFKTLLSEVLEFPLERFPEQRLSNQAAKLRAKKLMENIDEYF